MKSKRPKGEAHDFTQMDEFLMAGFSHTCDHVSHVQGLLLGCSSRLVLPTPPSSVPLLWVWLGFPGGSEGKSACNAGDPGSILGLGRSPGEGNGNPLQYSGLENPMDRGAWWLQSLGSQSVGHFTLFRTFLETLSCAFVCSGCVALKTALSACPATPGPRSVPLGSCDYCYCCSSHVDVNTAGWWGEEGNDVFILL